MKEDKKTEDKKREGPAPQATLYEVVLVEDGSTYRAGFPSEGHANAWIEFNCPEEPGKFRVDSYEPQDGFASYTDLGLHGRHNLAGQVIIEVRVMTRGEQLAEGWDIGDTTRAGCLELVLDNGVRVYASRDPEGNGPGALFFADREGKTFGLAMRKE